MTKAASEQRAGQGGTSKAGAAAAHPEAGASGPGDFDGLWDRGIAAFTKADAATSRAFDALLRSRWLLEPAGHALSALWRTTRLLRERQQDALRSQGLAAADDVLRAHAAVLRVEARLEAQTAELCALRADLAALLAERGGGQPAPAPATGMVPRTATGVGGGDTSAPRRPPRRRGKPNQE